MTSFLQKYARLLIEYCLELEANQKLLISSTTLAEPLVREIYRLALRKGAMVVTDLAMREQGRIFYAEANEDQLRWSNPLLKEVYHHFDAFLYIRAPFNLREDQSIDAEKRTRRGEYLRPLQAVYNQRTADGVLKRCLCQFPTQAAAQEAGMSLEEYEAFVFGACRLTDSDPIASWKQVRKEQQRFVNHLNQVDQVRYQAPHTNLSFSVKGRTWINSDGQANMPSGEVFTAPVEDSVNGHIHFEYPSIYRGHPVAGITLWVEEGQVTKWEALEGQHILDDIFQIKGARLFGEVAIGTNYQIKQPTKNILFDEKIGGTVHLAVGQSYIQTGGKNHSSIHWDMIADMTQGGKIFTDNELIYENGKFLI